MPKRPRYSRWRRLPGVYRIHERRGPDPNQELQRLILYLPAGTLDRAEAMGLRKGYETIQKYCEDLLVRAIESEHDREQIEDVETRRGALEGLKAIADDPDYLAELSASKARDRSASRPEPITPAAGSWQVLPAPEPTALSQAAEAVIRHAAAGFDDAGAFLPALRRGEPIGPETARDLIQALNDLEVEFRDAPRLDRRLAYALHRLAFEGQVLLTDAWQSSGVDAATVDVLRIVQEAVDRVLSGEDIRYYGPGAPAES
ncbi:MAG TPA: hypothetical protein VG406_26140 [Isosphaeraceae bacterium]|nr:hypothetical protein [Isosphaeraceae bacterium]